MTKTYIEPKNAIALFITAILIFMSLGMMLLLPSFALAENTDAIGDVTVNLLPQPTGGNSEYFTIEFSGTGTLNLDGWTVEDNQASVQTRHTFGEVLLNNGDAYTVCGDSSATSSVPCDDDINSGGNTVWNNDGDTLTLKDETGSVVVEVTYAAGSDDTEVTNTACIDYSIALSCEVANTTDNSNSPYSSIQDAIDDAEDGDTLEVSDGSTCEGFLVNVDNLTIEAKNTHGATISDEPSGSDRIVDIRANGVTVNGFVIVSESIGDGVGISISGDGSAASSATIINNDISSTLTGIQTTTAHEDGSNNIEDNVINSENVGISLQNSNNTVTGNVVTAALEGLGIGSSEFVLSGNTIENNTFIVEAGGVGAKGYTSADSASLEDGFAFDPATLIADNDFNLAAYIAGGTGTCDASTARHCTIFTDIQEAVDEAQDNDTVVLATDFETSEQITISKPLTIEGEGNTISTSGSIDGNGVILITSDNVNLFNLTVDGEGGETQGINIYTSLSIQLDNVTSINNGKSGIIVNGSEVTASDITTAGNSWHGINVDQGSGVEQPAILNISNTSSHDENSPATSTDFVDGESIPDIFIDRAAGSEATDATVNDINNQYISFNVPFRQDDGGSNFISEDNEARVYTLEKIETPAPTGGGGGGGILNNNNNNDTQPEGLVLGAEDTNEDGQDSNAENCEMTPILNDYLHPDLDNDTFEVMKLQIFLNVWIDAGLAVTGYYNPVTVDAVRTFQMQYADEILAPWGLTEPTGYVYITTLKTINGLVCPEIANQPMPDLVPGV